MQTSSKIFFAAVVAAGLGGCAVYPATGHGAYGTYGGYDGYGTSVGPPYVVEPAPVYIYGGGGYYGGRAGGRPHRPGYGGRDRDGIPNRADRDRDGDGVPNRQDARPNNPQRR